MFLSQTLLGIEKWAYRRIAPFCTASKSHFGHKLHGFAAAAAAAAASAAKE